MRLKTKLAITCAVGLGGRFAFFRDLGGGTMPGGGLVLVANTGEETSGSGKGALEVLGIWGRGAERCRVSGCGGRSPGLRELPSKLLTGFNCNNTAD